MDGDPARVPLSLARLEAFADGVFAIAITLLILEIRLPAAVSSTQTGLFKTLASLWPSYLGYAVSFVIIGIMWINHHNLCRLIDRIDHNFIVLNLLLLLCVAFTPFPTRVLAEYLTSNAARVTAVAFYGATFTLTAIVYNFVWWYAARDRRLLRSTVSEQMARAITRRYVAGPLMYFVATVLAFVSVPLSLGVVIGLAVLFLLPYRSQSGR